MINRVLLRIKLIQILYSYHVSGSSDPYAARNELLLSIKKAYDLYFYLFVLILDITRYAEMRIDFGRNKIRPTEEDLNPNMRFVENRFARQLAENTMLQEHLKDNPMSWSDYNNIIRNIFDKIEASSLYRNYMSSPETSYEDDKELWRRIFKNIIMRDEEICAGIEEILEEQSIYWVDDLEITASFVTKTIRMFSEGNGAGQELLPMFRNDGDRRFVLTMFDETVKNGQYAAELIKATLQNWEYDRIALMDIVIMKAAITELLNFPTIPVNATLNEFIEIAKSYSTERSGTFVNGVLDRIVVRLKAESKLQKVGYIPGEQE